MFFGEYADVPTRSEKEKARKHSRQFLKEKCEICSTREFLTIHHIIPLRLVINVEPENCQTLCRPCHDAVERGDRYARRLPDDPREWSKRQMKLYRLRKQKEENDKYKEWRRHTSGLMKYQWKDGELVTY